MPFSRLPLLFVGLWLIVAGIHFFVSYFDPENRRRIREEARNNQQAAQRRREEAEQEGGIKNIISAIHAVEKELHGANDEDAPRNKGEKRWHIAEVLGLWAAAIVGVIAIWIGSNDAAEQRQVMAGQLSEMRDEQRPWAFIHDIGLASPLTTNGDWINFSFNVEIHNSGRLPALETHINSAIFGSAPLDSVEKANGWQRDNCAKDWMPFKTGDTIFPGEVLKTRIAREVSRDQIIKDLPVFYKPHPGTEVMAPLLLVCVIYRDPFGLYHHTPYKWTIWGLDEGGNPCCLISLDPEVIKRTPVRLVVGMVSAIPPD